MYEAYELELAREGMGDSSVSEEQAIAWDERLALAPDLEARRELIHGPEGQAMPDYVYRSAMCTLLEVQQLLDARTDAAARDAEQMLERERGALDKAVEHLTKMGTWRKSQRIVHRRGVLELETAIQLNKPKADIKNLSNRLAVTMDLWCADAPPAEAAGVTEGAKLPTILDNRLVTTDQLVKDVYSKLAIQHDAGAFRQSAMVCLVRMDAYARQLLFTQVWSDHTRGSDSQRLLSIMQGDTRSSTRLTKDQRSVLFELYLDTPAFACPEVDGFVDLVVEDMKPGNDRNMTFLGRAGHARLSFAQLQTLLVKKPEIFRDDVKFALRYVCIMQAIATTSHLDDLDLRDDHRNVVNLETIEKLLGALNSFSSSVNVIRATLLHQQLKILMYQDSIESLRDAFVQYITLPRFGAPHVNQAYTNEFKSSELVTFSRASRNPFGTNTNLAASVEEAATALKFERTTSADDLRITKEVFHKILSSNAVTSKDFVDGLRKFLSQNFLETETPLALISSGLENLSNLKDKLTDGQGDVLMTRAISFCDSNPSYFAPTDSLNFYVRVRNVKTLTVQLYEIRTIDYYTRVRHEVRGNICLDGLLPNQEKHIDLTHLKPCEEARIPVHIPTKTSDERGVFVVEVFENDTTCRAILRKGFLRHIERKTTRGHMFTIFDEQGAILKDVSLKVMNLRAGESRAQQPRVYTPDADGTVTVPFRQVGESGADTFGILFCQNHFGYFHSSFRYLEAKFAFQASMFVDSEQLRPGCDAFLLSHPVLTIQGSADSLPLEDLVDVRLMIKFVSVNTNSSANVSKETELRFRTMASMMENACSFEIPLDAMSFCVELSARVSQTGFDTNNMALLPIVKCENSFNVQRVTQFTSTFTPHFVRRAALVTNGIGNAFEHRISVLGHNGEPIENKKITVSMKHLHFTDLIRADLQTDGSGEVNLGPLKDVEHVSTTFPGENHEWQWELPNLRVCRPRRINCTIGERVVIPLPYVYSEFIESWIKEGQIIVCTEVGVGADVDGVAIVGDVSIESVISAVVNKENAVVGVSFTPKEAGEYAVFARPLGVRYPVTVCKLKHTGNYTPHGLLVQSTRLLLATDTTPLEIMSQKVDQNADGERILEVQLASKSFASTEVWVVFKKFIDLAGHQLGALIDPSRGQRDSKLAFKSSTFPNEFLKRRKISDEFTYILQRRIYVQQNPGAASLLGASSLPNPTLIQNPVVLTESELEEMTLRDGDEVKGYSVNNRKMENMAESTMFMARQCSLPSTPPHAMKATQSSLLFLQHSSVVRKCSKVDQSGIVTFGLSDSLLFTETSQGVIEASIVAIDRENAEVASREVQISLNSSDGGDAHWQRRDVRLDIQEALPVGTPSMKIQHHECLFAHQHRVLSQTNSSKYALYESVSSAMSLWTTLCSDSLLPQLVLKLKTWSTMSTKEKAEFYYDNSADDLNFFLYRKDRDFFERYVKPLVAAKLSKSLLDLCVTEDVPKIRERYLNPGMFQNLNIIEKLLIASCINSPDTTRRICENVIGSIEDSRLTNLEGGQLTRIFDTVLSQGAVLPKDAYEVEEEDTGDEGDSAGMMFGCSVLSDDEEPRGRVAAQQQQQFRQAAPAQFGYGVSPGGLGCTKARRKKQVRYASQASSEKSLDDFDDNFGVESLSSDSEGSDGAQDDSSDEDVSSDTQREKNTTTRKSQPYIMPGLVRHVQEKRFLTTQKHQLDGRNGFWRDFAGHLLAIGAAGDHARTTTFLSSYFPEALNSLTEGILALSVLDLGLDATPTTIRQLDDGRRVQLEPVSDVILYHQEIGGGTVSATPDSVVIVKQKLIAFSDKNSSPRDFSDIHAVGEFIVNKVYTCIVNVTNITSSRLMNVNLLMQIPRGSIPLMDAGFYTKNVVIDVDAHCSKLFSFEFYFPAAGQFDHYPAHCAIGKNVVAWAGDDTVTTLEVLIKPTSVDLTSWSDVAARGTLDEVLSYLTAQKKLKVASLDLLRWRCQDELFYSGLIQYLRHRFEFARNIWKYALHHGDEQGIRELCSSSSSLCEHLGIGFNSSLVRIRELFRPERFAHAFDHTEFGPLLSRRAHYVSGQITESQRFGVRSEVAVGGVADVARIMNKKAREHYRVVCHSLAQLVDVSKQELLVMTYFLVLFNRTADAMKVFQRVREPEVDGEMEHSVAFDYMDSYLDFFRNGQGRTGTQCFPIARRKVAKHAKIIHDRWRERFQRLAEVLREYDELDASSRDGEDNGDGGVPAEVASASIRNKSEVLLDAEIIADEIEIKSQHLGMCEISFYRIDVELMFSTDPFDSFSASAASKSSLLMVEPWMQLNVNLRVAESCTVPDALTKTVVKVPSDLVSEQMMVRIREVPETRTLDTVMAEIDLTRSYFNSKLEVTVLSQAGLLQVLHGGRPVSSCYIKVYSKGSRGGKGKATFYKDGYTDIIGKFDYAATNGNLLREVEKFSILVSHPSLGTSVHQTTPPVLATTAHEFRDREAQQALLF